MSLPVAVDSSGISDEDLALLNELAECKPGERHEDWIRLLSRYPSLIRVIGPGRLDRFVEDELLFQLSRGDAGRYELWRAECRAMRNRYGCTDGDSVERDLVDKIVLAFVMARLAVVRYASGESSSSRDVDRLFAVHTKAVKELMALRKRIARPVKKVRR